MTIFDIFRKHSIHINDSDPNFTFRVTIFGNKFFKDDVIMNFVLRNKNEKDVICTVTKHELAKFCEFYDFVVIHDNGLPIFKNVE